MFPILQVLIHIGALTDKSGFHFAENAGKGGPLGELVQWSDLIASLYALGYNMDFSTEIDQLKSFLIVNHRGGCPTASETKYVAVFLDIVGLKQLKKLTKSRFQMYKYVVASFPVTTCTCRSFFSMEREKWGNKAHTHSFTHSLTHLLTHSLPYSLYSLTHLIPTWLHAKTNYRHQ